MKFIDTHIHLQDYKQTYATQIIRRAMEKGVEKFVCAGTSPADWESVEKLCLDFPDIIIPAFGIHPWYAAEAPAGWKRQLENLLEKYPEACVGECGLDGAGKRETVPQLPVFEYQTELARRHNRPLLLHAVKCQNELNNWWKKLPPRTVFHSYNGRREVLKQIVSAGAYVSFSFSILSNRDGEELLKMVPSDKILLETDGPYQSPLPDEETKPERLPELALFLAGLRNEDEKAFAARTYRNSLEFLHG